MPGLLSEVFQTARRLARTPSLAIPLVLSTALGVGAVTAAWTAVDAVLLRPLPYPEPERLVVVWERALDGSAEQVVVSPANFQDWRAGSRGFERLAAYNVWFPALTGVDRPEKLLGALVSEDFFAALGARPLHGRLFVPEEDRPGHDVVVLGHNLWRRRFGADPGIVGRAIVLDGVPYTVVGVLSPGFRHPEPIYLDETTNLWRPLGLDPAGAPRGMRYLRVVGRLRPEVAAGEAQAELDAIAARLAREHPAENEGAGVQVVPLDRQLVGDLGRNLLLLLAAAGLVLLAACANAAGLLLAGAVRQAHETAVRGALGASRWRLARRALAESLLPTLAGGALGLVLGTWGARALLAAGPRVARPIAIGLDSRAVAFTLAACLLTALVAGLAPAMAAMRADPAAALAEGGSRSGTLGARGHRLLALLVGVEAALSLPLLVGTGLLDRSLAELSRVPLGFNAERVLTARLELPSAGYPGAPEMRQFHQRLLARLAALPSVRAAGTTTSLPLTGLFDITREIGIESAEQAVAAGYRAVSPGYFPALGIPLRAGRLLDARDVDGAPPVVVVNEAFARAAWPEVPAVGRRIVLETSAGPVAREVVGVVGDVRHEGPTVESRPEVYLPVGQIGARFASLVLAIEGDPGSAAGEVRAAVREVDPDLALAGVQPMEDHVRRALAGARFHRLLAGVLAAVALGLALLGLYGTTSFIAGRRTREVGIRTALGADRAGILRLVLGRALLPVAVGIAAGLAASLALARLLANLLFGVSPRDPVTFVAAPLLLLLAALAAAWLPARRAARTDPAAALRSG